MKTCNDSILTFQVMKIMFTVFVGKLQIKGIY